MGLFNWAKDKQYQQPFAVDDFDEYAEDYAAPEHQKPWRTELPANAYAQPQHRQTEPEAPPPPPVTAEDLGRITAEAIKLAHEGASQALEKLGEEIQQRMLNIEALKLQAIQQMADCKELAEYYRDIGKHMSVQIEMGASDLNAAKDLIEDMRRKVSQKNEPSQT